MEHDEGAQANVGVPTNEAVLQDNVDSGDGSSQHSIRQRGYTACRDVYNMDTSRRIAVEWNEYGQPIGPGGRSLRTFLGTLARDPQKMPIHYTDWRKVPSTCKDDVFEFVQVKKKNHFMVYYYSC